ncbi:MAG TPA: DUF2283 domain-containing protein [Candidatus Paceibacterota bacterium]|nr:DUF2283 domain-containing protein [Candidatus Paceibacterota bacterium]
MKATYDKEADAMYITLQKGKVSKTQHISEWVLADVDKMGRILGIELLFVSTQFPKKDIATALRTGKIPVAA